MKIVRIFENSLFAFQYDGEEDNELRRLIKLWNDVEYIFQFVIQQIEDVPKKITLEKLVTQLIKNANEIDEVLNMISNNSNRNLEEFFKPLDNQEYHLVELSKQKGRKNFLRLYAIKIDSNCFVITGGAIKFHHLNKQKLHTQLEMKKLGKCRDYLKAKNVYDAISFYEYLNEQP